MKALRVRAAFWMAVILSCGYLAVTIAIAVAGIQQFHAENFGRRGTVEILIAAFVVLQPPVVLVLIIRAIRLRNSGRPFLIIARALFPLTPAALFAAFVEIRFRAETRKIEQQRAGTITYVCSTYSSTVSVLKLTEHRNPGRLGTWLVAWPGRAPIEATSFEARTGSYGGSQGIKWREPDGRQMTAYISFSDVLVDYGPANIWVELAKDNAAAKDANPFSDRFICDPDPASYQD
jgi:hypothetical protein